MYASLVPGAKSGTFCGFVSAEGLNVISVVSNSHFTDPFTLIVTVANHISTSKPDPPEIVPAKNVTLTIQLPDYFSATLTAREVTPDGFVEHTIKADQSTQTVALEIDSLTAGRIYIVQASSSL